MEGLMVIELVFVIGVGVVAVGIVVYRSVYMIAVCCCGNTGGIE
jgi:hypothetical protein